MEEIAYVSLSDATVPKNAEELKQKLISAGLTGDYKIEDGVLYLNNEDGIYEFGIAEAYDDPVIGLDAGIDVAGDFEDVAATIIDLQDVFEEAFPGCGFSHAYE